MSDGLSVSLLVDAEHLMMEVPCSGCDQHHTYQKDREFCTKCVHHIIDLLVACCHGAAELRDTKPDQQLTQAQQSMAEDY